MKIFHLIYILIASTVRFHGCADIVPVNFSERKLLFIPPFWINYLQHSGKTPNLSAILNPALNSGSKNTPESLLNILCKSPQRRPPDRETQFAETLVMFT